jgi:REP element-mobilizing transposase RayT
MPQSLSCLLLHLIFSTKDRFPLLRDDDLLTRTHAYLGGVFREADCPSLTIGGTADHVHAFFQLSRTLQVAKLVELIKSNSSRWLKTERILNFAWQRGYACFPWANRRPTPLQPIFAIRQNIIGMSATKRRYENSSGDTKSRSTSGTSGIKPRFYLAFSAFASREP